MLSDRYYFSSYAYNSVALPMDWVAELNSQCAELLRPDVNIFIDINPQKTLARIERERVSKEIYETRDTLSAVRENYFTAFARFDIVERVEIVDGDRPPEQIAEEIWDRVKDLFETE